LFSSICRQMAIRAVEFFFAPELAFFPPSLNRGAPLPFFGCGPLFLQCELAAFSVLQRRLSNPTLYHLCCRIPPSLCFLLEEMSIVRQGEARDASLLGLIRSAPLSPLSPVYWHFPQYLPEKQTNPPFPIVAGKLFSFFSRIERHHMQSIFQPSVPLFGQPPPPKCSSCPLFPFCLTHCTL